jgi:hypothetical protein
MRHITPWTACCGFALMLSAVAPTQAQSSNEQAYVTINQAVELPGITLQPGEYEFKLLDSPANRHIVQIFEKQTGKVVATILAVPAERREASDATVIAFNEAPATVPQPIRYWYNPGRTAGHEFVYPREQATRIAQTTGQRVLTAETTSAESMKTASVTSVEGNTRQTATVAPERRRPPMAESARPAAPTNREASARREPASTPESASPSRSGGTLPETASETPLVALVGVAVLLAVIVLRSRSRVV